MNFTPFSGIGHNCKRACKNGRSQGKKKKICASREPRAERSNAEDCLSVASSAGGATTATANGGSKIFSPLDGGHLQAILCNALCKKNITSKCISVQALCFSIDLDRRMMYNLNIRVYFLRIVEWR